MNRSYLIGILLILTSSCNTLKKGNTDASWTPLLGMDYSQNWELFLGVPHGSVKDLAGVDPQSDGKKGTPLGVNNDPKQVFTMEKIDGDPVLHISGEIYGALSSLKEYENYHLKLEFKWGEKKWEPRLNRLKDSGLLYHCQAPHGIFWNVWMQSQEFQVQETDVGDFYALSTTQMEIPAAKLPGEKEFNYQKGAQRQLFSNADKTVPTHCNKGLDNENPHGEWNTIELICLGDQSIHIVNGKVVMALYASKFATKAGEIKSLTKGKIQLQSEGAEIFYKNIEIKPINSVPKQFQEQL